VTVRNRTDDDGPGTCVRPPRSWTVNVRRTGGRFPWWASITEDIMVWEGGWSGRTQERVVERALRAIVASAVARHHRELHIAIEIKDDWS
jgi:hypothetical protein